MGALPGLVGAGGGANGTGFAAPRAASIENPVTGQQIQSAYGNVQTSMGDQQKLLAALQGQNGIQNQSQVYNQLQNIAAGTGPNPAQTMLAQATGANVANQAALMAGQRGASQNVGLIARQAAQAGGAAQQAAAGQAATMQANQSLNAINSAGGIAGTQVANQIGQTNANVQAQQAEQQALLNAQNAYNNAQVGNQSGVNAGNVSLANTNMQGQQGFIGGVFQGAGAALGMAQGGMIAKGYADGGDASAFQGPQSKFGQFLAAQSNSSGPNVEMPQMAGANEGAKKLQSSIGGMKLPKGGSGMDLGDPTELAGGAGDAGGITSMAPAAAMVAARGGVAHDYRVGGNVNAANMAQKAVKKGNSYDNDKIPAVLSEGEVVIPRSVMQSMDPASGAAKFVQAMLAKKGIRK